MHLFPTNPTRRQQWCEALSVQEKKLPKAAWVCSRHFPNGDTSNLPSLSVGKRFASPENVLFMFVCRYHQGNSGRQTVLCSQVFPLLPPTVLPPLPHPLPVFSLLQHPLPVFSLLPHPLPVFQSLFPHPLPVFSLLPHPLPVFSLLPYSLPVFSLLPHPHTQPQIFFDNKGDIDITVNTALVSRIKMLEQENSSLKRSLQTTLKKHFRFEDIAHNDHVVRCYTGFSSYQVLLAFFSFLGPAVNHLQYWGTKKGTCSRQKKLDPLNCLFLTLIKLCLNLTEQDLAFRFAISTTTVSRYFITWISFLYNHLKEIDWCPSSEQVFDTLPHAFKRDIPRPIWS